jgi:hypothetical protein
MGSVDPATVTSTKTVVSAATGVVLGALVALGGAQLVSPAPPRQDNVDLYVHHVTLQRPTQGGPTTVLAYTTSVKHLLDGGSVTRDNGATTCAAGPATSKLAAAMDAQCDPGGWLHVVELALNTADGGVRTTSYGTHPDPKDGGPVDEGELPKCEAVAFVQDASDLIFQEAINCAEGVLDQP